MTDNEIIQALECCCKITNCEDGCERKTDCILLHMHEIIDLIHRLQEQNAALISGQEALQKYIKNAKSEAIKEFACQILDLFPADKDFTTISRFTIKQKAKEMVGADNGILQ